jgi:UDP-N-acetylmuramyl pentapeptide phosphotransferase/UDP-N-acetylglucosamine-1-phosphate transferase
MFSIDLNTYGLEFMLLASAVGFIISYLSYETIMVVAKEKHLMDEPGERSSHDSKTPTLGGIAIYLSLLVVAILLGNFIDAKLFLMIICSLSVLLFLGLKDDLLVLSPRKKFLIQLLTGLLFILITDVRITSLFGLFGITSLAYLHSILFSLFVYILIINSYNMIDGIDGLAGGFGVIATLVLSILLYQDNINFALLGITTTGALLAFLRHNLSKNKKIFMGDTGTMIVGFCIAVLILRFLNTSRLSVNNDYYNTAPVIAISILFYPLLDTLRVFILRVFKYKTSPFTADRYHIHHRFIDLKLSHLQVSSVLLIINLLAIMMAFVINFKDWSNRLWFIGILSSALYLILFFVLRAIKKHSA